MQSASEAALHSWGPEWFAEVAESNGQRHFFNLTEHKDIRGSWSVEGGTECVEPEYNTTIWTVGRRKTRPEHDNTVAICEYYEGLLRQLIGAAETQLLIRNARDAARCNWADTWFAEVTYENQGHLFSLKARNDGSRIWRLAYNKVTLPSFHASASWACGRRGMQHENETREDIMCQAQHETQRLLHNEVARLTHMVLDIQRQLRYMAYHTELSSAHHQAQQWSRRDYTPTHLTSAQTYGLNTLGDPDWMRDEADNTAMISADSL